jgi:aldehyde dehydrogenase (NAD+)
VNARPKPLALYLFTTSKANEKHILTSISHGGGCINDTVVHLATPYLPFGGVGESGMGSYHGKASFDTFSHKKSIMKKSNLIDIPLRYPPYPESTKLLKKFMK